MPHAVVSKQQHGRAKQLRRVMTRAETLVWGYVKAGRIDGLGFRRQVPIKNYIADCVCFSANLIIELDGESHDFEERQKADQSRDAFFESEGLQVLRFANEQVLSNLEAVVEIIRQTAASRICGLPPSAAIAARAPPPTPPRQRGRGQDLSAGKRSS